MQEPLVKKYILNLLFKTHFGKETEFRERKIFGIYIQLVSISISNARNWYSDTLGLQVSIPISANTSIYDLGKKSKLEARSKNTNTHQSEEKIISIHLYFLQLLCTLEIMRDAFKLFGPDHEYPWQNLTTCQKKKKNK